MRRIAIVVAVLMAGCGGDDSPEQKNQAAIETATQEAHSEKQVVAALKRQLGAKPDPELGVTLDYKAGGAECSINVVMSSPEQVATYREAGDPVITNPGGNVGVKVGDAPVCLRAARRALRAEFPE